MRIDASEASRPGSAARWAVALALPVGVIGAGRALAWWLGLPPLPPLTWIMLLGGLCAPFVLMRYFWAGVIIPSTVGLACPGCAARPLRFAQAVSFGYRYYDCCACRRRFKRVNMDEPWEAADGPRDLPFYQPKPKTRLTRGEEWAWAGVFLGSLLVLPASAGVGYWMAGIIGLTTGSFCGFFLLNAMNRWLARMKEAAHRARHRDMADGLA